MRFYFKIRPKLLIIIAAVVSILMVLSAYLELQQSKTDVFHLLTEQANTLSETIVSSSLNALKSSAELENLIAQRLLNNARLIRSLDSSNALTHEKLIKMGKENNLYRINIFDKNGDRVLTNRIKEEDIHYIEEEKVNRYSEVEPILTGITEEMIIGLKKAMHVDEQRFAVAVARSGKRGAIVVNMNAEDFLQFRRRIGIGKIVRDIGDNGGIEYVALQDSLGIMAASSNVKELSNFSSDNFLHYSIHSDSAFTRLSMFDNHEVFEVIRGLNVESEFIGVFRIGISLDEIKSLETRMVRRLIVISIILATIGIILLGILLTNQNLKILSDEFRSYKSFTDSFLQNMKEGVITISNNSEITLFNTSAEKLFSIAKHEVLGKNLSELRKKELDFISKLVSGESESYKNVEIKIETMTGEKYLSVNTTPNYNFSKGLDSHTIIINDITESRLIEEQSKRNEKLIAMGELASGVAHEVRNPINSIGMIAQRLSREFVPQNDAEEYSSITGLLKDEVNRINKIITQFLKYAKPLDIQLSEIEMSRYMAEVNQMFSEQALQRKINFNIEGEKNLIAKIDPELYKQAILNIVQNAFDAVNYGGTIQVKYFIKGNYFFVTVTDNGKGIAEKDQSKIFDLYYTTRKEGTGLGLSISQKIISQHNGLIDFTTSSEGTIFKIKTPCS
jgi:PAS domain S-box-containing protein